MHLDEVLVMLKEKQEREENTKQLDIGFFSNCYQLFTYMK